MFMKQSFEIEELIELVSINKIYFRIFLVKTFFIRELADCPTLPEVIDNNLK